MGVDSSRADIPVAQKLLDGPDIIAIFQQMGGKEVPKSVTAFGFGNTCFSNGLFHRSLRIGFVIVVFPFAFNLS